MTECAKPIYIAELIRWHKECVAKSSYLKKIFDGGDLVTLPLVARCRESLLQFNQSHHVFNIKKENPEIPFTPDELTDLENMAAEISQLSQEAKKHWNAIISWIPIQDCKKLEAE